MRRKGIWKQRAFHRGRRLGVLLLLVGGLGCSRSYFDEDSFPKETCTIDTLRCDGARVQQCPHGVWQTLSDCDLFDMVCSETAGRVGCVEKKDTDPEDTAAETEGTHDSATPSMDAGPEPDGGPEAGGGPELDAGPDGGEIHPTTT